MLHVDGSQGEGGGQVLRSSLALALVTGTAFRIDGIRARRARPGLLRQHLTAVEAAAAVGRAQTSGAALGSRELVFRPRAVEGGDFAFAVGTAGSATLVLQTVLPALVTAPAPSSLVLEGGTHNPAAPPFDFLARAYLPLLARMGPRVTARLDRPGFFPAGGGRFRVGITPVPSLAPLVLEERGPLRRRRVRALVAHLPPSIAERELAVLRARLGWERSAFSVEECPASSGPGNVVLAELEFEALCEVFTGFGAKGVRAETVATRLAEELEAYLASDAPVGAHLADQLVLLLALAGGGSFRTLPPTDHTRTHLAVIEAFLGPCVALQRESETSWRLSVQRPGA